MAKQLQAAVLRTLHERAVPPDQHRDCLKWLLFYLDFCLKYHHAPRDEESLSPFLQKLAEKRQTPALQQQAAASVTLYYDLMKTWASAPEANPAAETARAPWDRCYTRLKEEVRLRQYSPKTFKTYATWLGQFQEFLQNKNPAQLDSEDARRFLTHLAVTRRVVASTQNQAA